MRLEHDNEHPLHHPLQCTASATNARHGMWKKSLMQEVPTASGSACASLLPAVRERSVRRRCLFDGGLDRAKGTLERRARFVDGYPSHNRSFHAGQAVAVECD